jgi:hypothetical protein
MDVAEQLDHRNPHRHVGFTQYGLGFRNGYFYTMRA